MPRKDNGGLFNTYMDGGVKVNHLRVRIASKEDKDFFKVLDDESKIELFKIVDRAVLEVFTDMTGSGNPETGEGFVTFSTKNIYLDFGCVNVSYDFPIEELLPKEIEYMQKVVKNVVNEIV